MMCVDVCCVWDRELLSDRPAPRASRYEPLCDARRERSRNLPLQLQIAGTHPTSLAAT
jgi:hypothetical protein